MHTLQYLCWRLVSHRVWRQLLRQVHTLQRGHLQDQHWNLVERKVHQVRNRHIVSRGQDFVYRLCGWKISNESRTGGMHWL